VTADRPSFREVLERLEGVVRELERTDVDLDRALALFEQGIRDLRDARALLEAAELRVRTVVEEADGTLGLTDADV
jgi:exodeoxyribonuclease VII small subunit